MNTFDKFYSFLHADYFRVNISDMKHQVNRQPGKGKHITW